MRNLSILFLLAILGILGCQSSKTSTTNKTSTPADSEQATTKAKPLYKPFAEFNGDTLQYLNYNFVEHKEQYIGKTFSVLYHDLEIPVKSSVAGSDHNNGNASPSISLYSVDNNTAHYHMHKDVGPLYIVIVRWEKPVSKDDYFTLYKASDGNWNSDYEALFAGEIIKDVFVLKHVNPQSKNK